MHSRLESRPWQTDGWSLLEDPTYLLYVQICHQRTHDRSVQRSNFVCVYGVGSCESWSLSPGFWHAQSSGVLGHLGLTRKDKPRLCGVQLLKGQGRCCMPTPGPTPLETNGLRTSIPR